MGFTVNLLRTYRNYAIMHLNTEFVTPRKRIVTENILSPYTLLNFTIENNLSPPSVSVCVCVRARQGVSK